MVYQPPGPAFKGGKSGKPAPKMVRIPITVDTPDGGKCWRPGPDRIPEAEYGIVPFYRSWEILMKQNPRCPVTPAEGPDVEEVVTEVLERFPLPAPRPYVAPGRAITGLRAFLEPNLAVPLSAGTPTYSGARSTVLGDIQVDATAVYYVDWGDETTGPHAGPGGPWPNGNIAHVYRDMGPVDVVVTAEWSVVWRMGAESGELTMTTKGTIVDFPVGQLQAVRNR